MGREADTRLTSAWFGANQTRKVKAVEKLWSMPSHLKTIKVLGEVDVSYYVDLFSDIDDADWMGEFAKFSKKNIPFF